MDNSQYKNYYSTEKAAKNKQKKEETIAKIKVYYLSIWNRKDNKKQVYYINESKNICLLIEDSEKNFKHEKFNISLTMPVAYKETSNKDVVYYGIRIHGRDLYLTAEEFKQFEKI